MKNLRLAVKLVGGFMIVALIVVVVGAIGLVGTGELGDGIEEIGLVRLPSVDSLFRTEIATDELMLAQRVLLSERVEAEERAEYMEEWHRARADIYVHLDAFLELPATEEEARLSGQLQDQLSAWAAVNDEWLDLTDEFDRIGILNPDDLGQNLERFRGNHYELQLDVAMLLLAGEGIPRDADDPTACAFGRWLADFRTDNQELAGLLEEIRRPHDRFHQIVGEIEAEHAAGNAAAAMELYQQELAGAGDEVFGYFDEMIASAVEAEELRDRITELAIGPIAERAYAAWDTLDELHRINAAMADRAVAAAESSVDRVLLIVMLGIILGAILAVALGFILARGITKPVAQAASFAQALAEGDMSATIDVYQKDEVGAMAEALRTMRDRLTQVVREVQAASENVSSGSEEMSSAAQQLSQGASEQASSGEEVAASMEQITSSINQNWENSQATDQLAQKAARQAGEGGRSVDETVQAMKDIADRISIIEEIAGNTNLLALNAAIEAARAGEHGKGFAVVASEVRKLAERSKKAAVEIGEVSQSSVSKAELAGRTIAEVVEDVKKTAELVQEISAASREQNTSAEQVNQAIMQLDQVTQQNASSSEELASTSEELSAQAVQLQQAMGFFKLNGGNGRRVLEARGTTAQGGLPPGDDAAARGPAGARGPGGAIPLAGAGREPVARRIGDPGRTGSPGGATAKAGAVAHGATGPTSATAGRRGTPARAAGAPLAEDVPAGEHIAATGEGSEPETGIKPANDEPGPGAQQAPGSGVDDEDFEEY